MRREELAHWTYRVGATERELKADREYCKQLAYFGAGGQTTEDRIKFNRWLHEEARYMVELGRIEHAT